LTTWQHWVASDGLGIITLAPLLIELAPASRDRPPLSELVEGALTVAALALVSGFAIFLRSELLATVGPVAVLFAPLLWLAARCRPVFAAAAAAFIVSLSIVWTTTFGIGYFGNPGLSVADRVLAAQLSILLVTIGASVLAALFAEIRDEIRDRRRLAEAALHASETQRYLIETERLAALGGLVANFKPDRHQPHGRLGPGQVEITFSDDGSGIAEQVQRHVFDPFFATRRAQGNTGLGLYIVHNLVTQQLGGKITLVSAPGKGTTLCMTLPLLAPG